MFKVNIKLINIFSNEDNVVGEECNLKFLSETDRKRRRTIC
jgi:hypothetical protein